MRFVLIVGLLTGLFLLFPPSPIFASSLSSTSYVYDNVGNIQSISNGIDPTKNLSYTYDDLYRLQGVSGGYSSNYIYDADGNILTKNEDQNLTLTYIPSDSVASHGPKSVNGRLLKYDLNGNLIEDAFSNLKITYDYDNRPVEIRKLDSNILIAKYYYDGEGKRVKKEVYVNNTLSKTTQYVNQYFEKEIPVAGQTTVRKFYAGAAYRENGTLTYTTTDHLSSTTLLTNSSGGKLNEYRYYPYGSPIQPPTPLPPNSWIGQKRDDESGLYFLNARYYSPTMGRFVSVDPARDPLQRMNNYSYAGNNPLLLADPSGLCAIEGDEESCHGASGNDPLIAASESLSKYLCQGWAGVCGYTNVAYNYLRMGVILRTNSDQLSFAANYQANPSNMITRIQQRVSEGSNKFGDDIITPEYDIPKMNKYSMDTISRSLMLSICTFESYCVGQSDNNGIQTDNSNLPTGLLVINVDSADAFWNGHIGDAVVRNDSTSESNGGWRYPKNVFYDPTASARGAIYSLRIYARMSTSGKAIKMTDSSGGITSSGKEILSHWHSNPLWFKYVSSMNDAVIRWTQEDPIGSQYKWIVGNAVGD